VDRLLVENAEDIERATGLHLRVVRALVRDPAKERASSPAAGVLTTDFASIRDDPSIGVVAELMGGIWPARTHVLALLAAGKPVVTAHKPPLCPRTRGAARSPAPSFSPPPRTPVSSCGSRRACARRSR